VLRARAGREKMRDEGDGGNEKGRREKTEEEVLLED